MIKFERNNKTIALNMLCINYNTKTIRVAYRSEHNNKCHKQAIFLMITDGNKWHYLAVEKLTGLLLGVTSKYVGDF